MLAVFTLRSALAMALALAGGCVSDALDDEDAADDWDDDGKGDGLGGSGPLRVSELLVSTVDGRAAYVELRNTGKASIELLGYRLSVGTRRVELAPVGGRSTRVMPGELALVVDDDLDPTTLDVADHVAVVTLASRDLSDLLRSSRKLLLRDTAGHLDDRIDGTALRPPAGVPLERDRLDGAFVVSTAGATPGMRNGLHDASAIQVWFTRPVTDHHDGIEPHFVDAIASARAKVHGAFYQINNMRAVRAMTAARERGVEVQLTTDADWYYKAGREGPKYQTAYSTLEAAGIKIQPDVTRTGELRGSALMHSKFAVIDDRAVWTGSYNLIGDDHASQIAVMTHADNALLIESRELAAAHEREFQEMFTAKRFGTQKLYESMKDRNELVTGFETGVGGARVEAFFAPKYRAIDAMVKEIESARSSVYFACFSFYHPRLGTAMIDRFRAGVDLRGLFYTASTGGASSQYPPMIAAGADVREPSEDVISIFLHHKFVILDYGTSRARVLTGSFNFSDSAANKNDEVLYVIHDRFVVEAYYRAFRELYDPGFGHNKSAVPTPAASIVDVLSAEAAGDGSPRVRLVNHGAVDLDLRGLRLWDRDVPLGAATPITELVDGVTTLAPGATVDLDASRAFELSATDPLVLVDELGRIVSSFDAPGFAGPGQSWTRVDATLADYAARWVASPTPVTN